MKDALILKISERMDSNKKKDRNEQNIIRLGSKARAALGLTNDKEVELWQDAEDIPKRLARSRVLKIYKAYSSDLAKLKRSGISEEDYKHVGFVTSKTFEYICGASKKKKGTQPNIWLANTIEETVIGSDPEFVLLENDTCFKYAASIDDFSYDDKLGSDGPLAELRPAPATTVDTFVQNIQKLLKHHPNRKYIRDYIWMAGCIFEEIQQAETYNSRDLTIGGHIHIGLPLLLLKKLSPKMDAHTLKMGRLYAIIVKVLGEYIAIPTMKVDGVTNSIARRRKHYGKYNDIRTSQFKMEYRTLSGSWLAHPELAKAVLGSTKAVMHALFKAIEAENYDLKFLGFNKQPHRSNYGGDEFQNVTTDPNYSWEDCPITNKFLAVRTNSVMEDILLNGNIKFNKAFYSQLETQLTELSTYNEYKPYIDKFLTIVESPNTTLKKINYNLKETWVKGEEFII